VKAWVSTSGTIRTVTRTTSCCKTEAPSGTVSPHLPGDRPAGIRHVDPLGIREVHLSHCSGVAHDGDRGRLGRDSLYYVAVLHGADDGRLDPDRLVAQLLAHRDADAHGGWRQAEAPALQVQRLPGGIDWRERV
jgi:hypothetical protein